MRVLRTLLAQLRHSLAATFDTPHYFAAGLVFFAAASAFAGCSSDSSDASNTAVAPNLNCETGELACAGACVDPQTDQNNCGTCGAPCEHGKPCLRGQCVEACPAELTACGGTCVDVSRSNEHCGACDTACAAPNVCSNSQCQAACKSPAPIQCAGTCTDTLVDPRNCGACGIACRSDLVCSSGRCQAGCGGETPDACNGACVDMRTNPKHCGACGKQCGAGEVCSAGLCAGQCQGQFSLQCGSLCVDPQQDPRFCGDCEIACGEREVCSAGVCRKGCVGENLTECGGFCVDLETDRNFCGSCSVSCIATAVCSGGVCSKDCGGRTPQKCGDNCVATKTDPLNCGDCNVKCAPGELCIEGACTLQCGRDTPTRCGNGCVDLQSNPAHCGNCETQCPSGEVCNAGKCQLACGGLTKTACGQSCVDTQTNNAHCGTCDKPCGIGERCSVGKCAAICPPEAQTLCGSSCVDTSDDLKNCGRCGKACDALQQCVNGSCVAEILHIAAGESHMCAIMNDESIVCSGPNYSGGIGETTAEYGEYGRGKVRLSSPPKTLTLGGDSSCAIAQNGKVYCWGTNLFYTLGDGTQNSGPTPVQAKLPDNDPVLALDAYGLTFCAVLKSGQIWCWGDHTRPVVGHESTVPAAIDNLSGSFRSVALGPIQACARTNDANADVYCWGHNNYGHIGVTPDSFRHDPTKINGLSAPPAGTDLSRTMVIGFDYVCAIVDKGEVYCWGRNTSGILGQQSHVTESITPVKVPLQNPARALVNVKNRHAICALTAGGAAECWGQHYGAGSTMANYAKTDIVIAANVKDLVQGQGWLFAELASGEVLSFGSVGPETMGRPFTSQTRPAACCSHLALPF